MSFTAANAEISVDGEKKQKKKNGGCPPWPRHLSEKFISFLLRRFKRHKKEMMDGSKKEKDAECSYFSIGRLLADTFAVSSPGKAGKSCTWGRLKETRRFSCQARRRRRCILTKGGRKTCNYWKGCRSSTCCFAPLLKWIWDSCYLGNCSLRSAEAQMTHRSHFQGILAADVWFNVVSRQIDLYLKSLISNKWLIGPLLI